MKLKSYFFEFTKKATKRGNRFLNGDRPDESTFRELVDSTTFKTEVGDLAKEYDPTKPLEQLSGLGIAVTDADAKIYKDRVNERMLFVQPHQLPEVSSAEDNDMVFDSNDFVSNFSGEKISVSIDTVSAEATRRNIFQVFMNNVFITWLRNSINALQNSLVEALDLIAGLNVRVTAIEDALGTVSGGTINITEFLPVGTYLSYAGETAPNVKFLKADGAAISRTTYAGLFSVIGVSYGAGDGVTTFNLPNASDRLLRYNTGGIGQLTGGDEVTLSGNQLPLHKHAMDGNGANVTISGGQHLHSSTFYGRSGSNIGGTDLSSSVAGNSITIQTHNDGSHTHSITGETGYQGNYTQQAVDIKPKSISATLWVKVL